MHRRSLLVLGAVVVAGLMAVAAYGSTARTSKTITISFMEAMSSGKQKPALDLLTQRFMKQHPNVKVQLIAEPNYGVLQQKEQAAIAAGDPPTIAQVYENWAAGYADAKTIVPLDNFVNGRNGLTKAQQSLFWKGIWKDLYLPDGKLWMWPFNKSDYVMYYNADKLSKAGLSVPKTWVQFAQVAKSLTKNGDWAWSTDTGTLAAPADGAIIWMALVHAFGGSWIQNGKPTLNTTAGVKALQFLKDLKNHGALQLGTNYPGETALGAGRSAFDLSTIAGYPYEIAAAGGKFPVKVAALPTGRNGEGNVMAGTNIVIFAHASLAQRAAAWQYMKFLTEPRQTAYWSEETGYLPVTKTGLAVMKKFVASHPYAQVAAQSLNVARGNPPYAWWTTAEGQISEALQASLGNGANPKAALDTAQAKAMAAVNGG